MRLNSTCYYSFLFETFIICFSLTDIKAQPTNDDICSATTLIAGATSCTGGTNVSSTLAGGDLLGSCWVGATKSNTVWYKFVAPTYGNVTVTTEHAGGGTLTDPQLAVFSSSDGTCSGTLTEIGCNDDIASGNRDAAVSLTGLTTGTTYFVELDGYSTLTGTFCIDVHDGGSVLINDDCANAMNLWVGVSCNLQAQCTYTNYPMPSTNATGEAWETAPACWSQGTTLNTVWFIFTAVATSTRLQIPTNDGTSTTNPHAGIYSGSCGSLTLIACQEDKATGGGSGSVNRGVDITFTTTIGEAYYIQYDSDAAVGCNNICVSSTGGLSVPGNNTCGSATPLALNTPSTGNNWLASADGGFDCGSVENSVWYSFTPATTGNFKFALSDQTGLNSVSNSASPHTNFYAANLQMAVYTSNCTPSSASQVGCSDPFSSGDFEIQTSLSAGSSYLVLIDGLGGASGQFNLMTSPVIALPINLVMFTGKNDGDINILEWTTTEETNNDYFTIERSGDALHFTSIGTVKGKGNSTKVTNYILEDNAPLTGIAYYRLKQTDINGHANFPGEIITINYNKSATTFNVYPNPNDGNNVMLRISNFHEKEILIVVNDSYGREMYSKILLVNSNHEASEAIDPYNRLPSGIYIITGTSNNQLYQQKIVIR